PDIAEGAADTQIDLANVERPLAKDAEPALEELWPGISLEYQVAWGIEHARHRDVAVGWGRDLEGSGGAHRRSPFLRGRRGWDSAAFNSSSTPSRRSKLCSQNSR